MKIINLIYVAGLVFLPNHALCGNAVEHMKSSITSHFQQDLVESVPNISKDSSTNIMFKVTKSYRAKFVFDPGTRNIISARIKTENLSQDILVILGDQIKIMSNLSKQPKDYALMASTSISWEKVLKLMNEINPETSFENAIFWLFLKVDEPFYLFSKPNNFEQFQLSYTMLLVNSFRKYRDTISAEGIDISCDEQKTFKNLDAIYKQCKQLSQPPAQKPVAVRKNGYVQLMNYHQKTKTE